MEITASNIYSFSLCWYLILNTTYILNYYIEHRALCRGSFPARTVQYIVFLLTLEFSNCKRKSNGVVGEEEGTLCMKETQDELKEGINAFFVKLS